MPLPDPIQQKIIDAIDIRFKTILISNGYFTDVGQHVDWWKKSLAIANLPGMNLRNRTESRSVGPGVYDRTLTINIEASVSGSDSPKVARQIEADVEKAISVDETWDYLAHKTDILGRDLEAAQAENKIAQINITIQIEYHTGRGQPF